MMKYRVSYTTRQKGAKCTGNIKVIMKHEKTRLQSEKNNTIVAWYTR